MFSATLMCRADPLDIECPMNLETLEPMDSQGVLRPLELRDLPEHKRLKATLPRCTLPRGLESHLCLISKKLKARLANGAVLNRTGSIAINATGSTTEQCQADH